MFRHHHVSPNVEVTGVSGLVQGIEKSLGYRWDSEDSGFPISCEGQLMGMTGRVDGRPSLLERWFRHSFALCQEHWLCLWHPPSATQVMPEGWFRHSFAQFQDHWLRQWHPPFDRRPISPTPVTQLTLRPDYSLFTSAGFSHLSSHAVNRAHWSRTVSRAIWPWSS